MSKQKCASFFPKMIKAIKLNHLSEFYFFLSSVVVDPSVLSLSARARVARLNLNPRALA